MNMNNDFAKELVKNDIFNYSINPKILKLFLSKCFMKQTILGKRDDFTTNRESAILFGIPVCFIEGILVGRSYENNKEKFAEIKELFSDCYICNLDGKVIMI